VRKAILEALGGQPRVVRVPRYQRLKGRGSLREFRLDDRIAPDSARTFGESLPDLRAPHPAKTLIACETASRLRGHLRSLPARDRAVIAARYGLHGGPAMTLMEVGDRLSLSRERVRQIESAALSRLRRAMAR
jgi:RNA polymerase sigma factor (sigma-70 family)